MNEEELLLIAIKAAIDAGKAINQVYKSGYSVDYKADESPLTTADIAAHRIIKNILSDTGLPFISEEESVADYNIRKEWSRYWLCDPLDGTKEFIHGNGEFTVNIALIENGIPVMGVIYAPVPDLLYFAIESIGAWKMGEVRQTWDGQSSLKQLIHLSQNLPLKTVERPYTIVCSRSHMNSETKDFVDRLMAKKPGLAMKSYGSSLKFCAIAEGSADLYPRFAPTMEWDTAAGHAIAVCSGATVIDNNSNSSLVYNKRDLTNPGFTVVRDE